MKLSIAIPDSCLKDEKTQLDKSRKISIIARAAAIFKIHTIFIYEDGNNTQDKILLSTILKYLETPPFLRKMLYPKINELKYAGVLHPLKIPSHTKYTNFKNIKENEIRDGIVLVHKGKKFVDVGSNQLFAYHGKKDVGNRTTIKFKRGFPNFEYTEISRQEIGLYWGYQIKEKTKLSSLLLPSSLSSWKGKIILTSRKGKIPNNEIISQYQKSADPILLVFGTVDKGLHEILGSGTIKNIQNAKFLNFFPIQATETIRLEEALLGILSILNFEKTNLKQNI